MKIDQKLVVAISSRALFNLEESHRIYEEEGVEAYRQYQIDHENEILEPGDAFRLVKKLLAINAMLDEENGVEVLLLSRNSADTGLRIFNSIKHWDLPITRAAFSGGQDPHRYVSAFGAHLFLSTDLEDVRWALDAGFAAASIVAPRKAHDELDEENFELRIAFDGDAVIFSDESERVFVEGGLEAFTENEVQSVEQPLQGGPFKSFLAALHRLQTQFDRDDCPIRTALVTARSAPAHERVVKTLRSWNIRIDESLFLGGLEKGAFLKAFGADVFFDDQEGHCASANDEQVVAGHVPHGVKNN